LARGFVSEELVVVGPPPAKGAKRLQDDVREKKAQVGGLWKLIQRARGGVLDVDWRKEDRVSVRSNCLRKVMVGGEVYQVGHCFILVRD
jgi:DNA (cytosine-5)-methyltransferase 1